ncbi:MAG TPA: (2Fe-2S) ferredoxin domain-containing protein [Desulfobacteria bacterium]|nr:(2Fe-2S) ferredoxin domain-containing protein [Desulfobacteria bacterium]
MNLQELEQIKDRIISKKAMQQDRKSPRITVGMGTCGIKAGARRVLDELDSNLGKDENVIVTHVGCIGLCSYEPVVEVSMPGQSVVTYGGMTPERVREVIKEHILGGRPVEKWIVSTR